MRGRGEAGQRRGGSVKPKSDRLNLEGMGDPPRFRPVPKTGATYPTPTIPACRTAPDLRSYCDGPRRRTSPMLQQTEAARRF